MKKMYMDDASGEFYTLEEVKEGFEQFKYEMNCEDTDFEDWLNHQILTGMIREVEE
jgi:hypothetical protein